MIKRFSGLVVAGVIGVGLLILYLTRDREDPKEAKRQTVAVAHARLAACLLGQRAGEAYEHRLREVMIAAHDDPTWPKRCAPYAEVVEKLGKDPGRAAALLSTDEPANVFKPEVTWLLRDLDDVTLDFDAVTRDVPRPKEPTVPGDPGIMHTRSIDMAVGYPELSLKLGQEVVCRFAAKDDGLEPVAHCSFRADSYTGSPRSIALVRGSGANVLAHDYRSIVPWAGGPPVMSRKMAITPSRVGDIVYGIAETKRTTLLVLENGATRATPIDRPVDSTGEMTLTGDQLVWYERGHVFARSLAGTVGPTDDLGAAGPGTLRESCIGENGTVAAAHQLEGGGRHIALRIGDRWKLVGPVEGTHESRLHCLGDRVVLMTVTHSEDGVRIARVDCTLEGCTPTSVVMKLRSSEADAVPMGDEVLFVWAHEAIWAQRARLTELATAKRIPLFNGFGTTARFIPYSRLVQGIETHVRGKSAIVVLNSSGARAVHLRDGRAEPVRVVYE